MRRRKKNPTVIDGGLKLFKQVPILVFRLFRYSVMLLTLFQFILFTSGFASLPNKDANSTFANRTSAMILKQAEMCPYVSLCTKTNTSVFEKVGSNVPCCQECSCNYTCLSHGTCCPDFYIDGDNKNLVTMTNLSRNSAGEKKTCVKTKHGNQPNDDGYFMMTSCPDTYENDVIKYHCESKLDILSTGSLLHHIPVSDTVSGLTYKNYYCEKCNKDENTSTMPWDVWFECRTTNFYVPYYSVGDLFELVVNFISQSTRDCNIAFTLSTAISDNLLELQPCNVDTFIDTCLDAYHGSDIEKLCNTYSWAVKVSNGAATYRNYACMLCNGQEFKERCYSPVKQHFAVSLMVDMDKKVLVATNRSAQVNTSQIIARPFADEAGYVYCREGFIYDRKKGTCRRVLCPLYFFLKKGKCVPMFGSMKGTFYKVCLEILVPDSLRYAQQDDIETGISDGLYDFLCDKLGDGMFEFHLWSSQSVSGTFNITQPYLVAIVIAGNSYDGKYALVLEFVNNFVLRDKKLVVFLGTGGKIKNATIGIRFSSSIRWHKVKPSGIEGLRLAKSSTAKTGKTGIENATEVHLSESSFCYNVLLKDTEFRGLAHTIIRVFETDAVLAYPSYWIYAKNNRERLTFSCVNKAFNKIPDCSNNVFLKKESCRYRYMSTPKVNDQDKDDNIYGLDDFPDNTHDDSSLERSMFATLCTIGVLVLIIGTRYIIKRLLRRNDNPSEANPELDIELDEIPT